MTSTFSLIMFIGVAYVAPPPLVFAAEGHQYRQYPVLHHISLRYMYVLHFGLYACLISSMFTECTDSNSALICDCYPGCTPILLSPLINFCLLLLSFIELLPTILYYDFTALHIVWYVPSIKFLIELCLYRNLSIIIMCTKILYRLMLQHFEVTKLASLLP